MSDYDFSFGYMLDYTQSDPEITNIKDRFKHTYILGKTGMGKSVLMERMAHYDLSQGYSVIYLDPKGESVNRLYNYHKINPKVNYVSFDYPMVINPLTRKGYDIDTIIKEFVQVMDILITATSINPESSIRMKEIISKSLKGFKQDKVNFQLLYDFLNYHDIRKNYVNNPDEFDPKYSRWWKEIDDLKNTGYQKWADFIRTMSSITSRISQFLDNDQMKHFISGENELYIDSLVDNNKSLLVNLKTVDEDNMIFIANLIVYAVYSYLFQETNRKPLLIYIDEFQLVSSSLFPTMLQLSRGYQVGFTLAHQDFLAIDPKVLSAVFGNVNVFVVFRCGDVEAERFANIFDVKDKDLFNLDDYNAYLRIGNKNTLIECYPPKFKDNPKIILDKQHKPITNFNFLKTGWIML